MTLMSDRKYVDLVWENDKPRVLFLTEGADWAFRRIGQRIRGAWSHRYQFQIADFHSLEKNKKNEADLVIGLWWGALAHLGRRLKYSKAVVCVYDHFSWRHNPLLFRRTVLNADGLVSCNEDFHQMLKRDGRFQTDLPMWVCEDGVDTKAFSPSPIPEGLIGSWVGNSVAGGGKLKGLHLIREACEKVNIKLLVADKQKDPVPHEEVAEKIYHRSSFGIYASTGEGTPNPLLETMACGRPVVITAVGLAPKLINDGRNGIIIQERTLKGILEALDRLKDINIQEAGVLARRAVEPFDWSIKVKDWESVLALADGI